jgi:hypothetical protein
MDAVLGDWHWPFASRERAAGNNGKMAVYLARMILGAADAVAMGLVGVGFHAVSRAGRGHRREVLCLVIFTVPALALTVLFGLGWYAAVGAAVACGYWTGHWAARSRA